MKVARFASFYIDGNHFSPLFAHYWRLCAFKMHLAIFEVIIAHALLLTVMLFTNILPLIQYLNIVLNQIIIGFNQAIEVALTICLVLVGVILNL